MTELYAYKEPGRRPVTYLAALVFLFLLWSAVIYRAPAFYYIPVVGGGFMILYILVKNPVSGLLLLPDRLILSAWDKPNPVPVKDIARVEIVSWSDTTDMNVHLKSGRVIKVFSGDIPPRASFAQALSNVGIAVELN